MKLRPGYLFRLLTGTIAKHSFHQPGVTTPARVQPRTPHAPMQGQPPPNLCACEAFFVCDLLYQLMTPQERDTWRRAVLRPHTSPYDLFMHECLWCANRGLNLPDTPSPHGGYTMDAAHCAGEREAPEACAPPPPPLKWLCTGPPDWQCHEADEGDYESEAECLLACEPPPTRWHCTGAPDWNCVEEAEGEYDSEADCLELCAPAPPGEDCEHCEPPTPLTLQVAHAAFTGDYAILNGNYTYTQLDWLPCAWVVVTAWGWAALDLSGVICMGWYVNLNHTPPPFSGLEGGAYFQQDCAHGQAGGLICSVGACHEQNPEQWQNATANW